jgi:hypothetical protein
VCRRWRFVAILARLVVTGNAEIEAAQVLEAAMGRIMG